MQLLYKMNYNEVRFTKQLKHNISYNRTIANTICSATRYWFLSLCVDCIAFQKKSLAALSVEILDNVRPVRLTRNSSSSLARVPFLKVYKTALMILGTIPVNESVSGRWRLSGPWFPRNQRH